jgi:hypothetical protein
MPDPTSNRLQQCRDEIDKVFGPNYAEQHCELVAAMLIATSLDMCGLAIAAALSEDEPLMPVRRTGILRRRRSGTFSGQCDEPAELTG